jgi:hypothetical protein
MCLFDTIDIPQTVSWNPPFFVSILPGGGCGKNTKTEREFIKNEHIYKTNRKTCAAAKDRAGLCF